MSPATLLALPLLVGNCCLRQPIAPPPEDTIALLVDTYRGHRPGERLTRYWPEGNHGARAKVDIAKAVRGEEQISCLRLTYDVGSPDGEGTPDAHAIIDNLELPANIRALRVQFLGDGSGNDLGLTVVDCTGERLFYNVAEMATAEWSVSEVGIGALESNWSGNNDRVPDYPLRLTTITVLASPASRASYGEVYVDAVEAVCEAPPGMADDLINEEGRRGAGWETRGEGLEHASVSSTPDPHDPATAVARLAYGLSPGRREPGTFISYVPPAPEVVDGPGMILADIYGDASRNRLQFELVDGDGDEWRGPHPAILLDWTGWRTVYAFTGGATWLRVTDADRAVGGEYPVRLDSLVLTPGGPWSNDSALEGELLVGQCRFVYVTPETDATCRQQLTDARKYPPAP